MRRNIHYKPSKSASILSGVIACAMGVFGLFTIPSIGAMIGFKAIFRRASTRSLQASRPSGA